MCVNKHDTKESRIEMKLNKINCKVIKTILKREHANISGVIDSRLIALTNFKDIMSTTFSHSMAN